MISTREVTELEKKLVEGMEEFEIIDCHEHLGPEKERVESPVDLFTLFSHYTHWDLVAAGMTEVDYQSLFNQNIPLECRWELFAPYWERIRWGSYARAALLAAEKFYGFEDINDRTYESLSNAVQEANKLGIYERVLRKGCRIHTALTQCGSTKLDTPLLTPLMPIACETETALLETWDTLSHPPFDPDATVQSLDDYLDALRGYVVRVKTEGAVGLKMISNPYNKPIRKEAVNAFECLRKGSESRLVKPNPLRDYVIDQIISFATKQDLVIAVHTGYWGDFRELDPLHMIPIIQRHPKARFDIYHLGYPWMRETLMLGKNFSNVWLNFCWTHIISQRFATAALDEAIDLIPMNKLLAFGGDYKSSAVEKVYGHLVMARENIARVLAKRIIEKQMTETQALAVAQKWFWGNPKELYRLELRS